VIKRRQRKNSNHELVSFDIITRICVNSSANMGAYKYRGAPICAAH
jgi:hypothetical protein